MAPSTEARLVRNHSVHGWQLGLDRRERIMWSSRSAPSSPPWRVSHFILFYFEVDFLVSPLLNRPISLIINSGDRINYLGTRLSIGHQALYRALCTNSFKFSKLMKRSVKGLVAPFGCPASPPPSLGGCSPRHSHRGRSGCYTRDPTWLISLSRFPLLTWPIRHSVPV